MLLEGPFSRELASELDAALLLPTAPKVRMGQLFPHGEARTYLYYYFNYVVIIKVLI